ncbi:MAG: response regulator [Acidimicrobiales bacterium]|jgi:two-component system chemotaxis response regulator CheY
MKVLITDDSKAMRMIVMRHVRQAGFDDAEFVEAANGLEGLEAVRNDEPDLILCDWNMPEMDGHSFLKALRSEGFDTPFGFVTSESTPDMVALARGSGAMFLIAKPFTVDIFRDTLAAAGVA